MHRVCCLILAAALYLPTADALAAGQSSLVSYPQRRAEVGQSATEQPVTATTSAGAMTLVVMLSAMGVSIWIRR